MGRPAEKSRSSEVVHHAQDLANGIGAHSGGIMIRRRVGRQDRELRYGRHPDHRTNRYPDPAVGGLLLSLVFAQDPGEVLVPVMGSITHFNGSQIYDSL